MALLRRKKTPGIEASEEALSGEKAKLDALRERAAAADEFYLSLVENAGYLPDNLDPADGDALSEEITARADGLGRAKEEADYLWEAVRNQHQKVNDARRDLIAAHANAEAELVEVKETEYHTHRNRVEKLLADLKDVDWCGYVPEYELRIARRHLHPAEPVRIESKSRKLSRELSVHRSRVAVLRRYLETGELSTFHSGSRAGIQLKADERPDILFGPNAELPDDAPKRKPLPAPAQMRLGEPTW